MQLFISDALTIEQAEEVIRNYIDQNRPKMLAVLRAQDPLTYKRVIKQVPARQNTLLAGNTKLLSMLSHTILYGYGFHPGADVILRSNRLVYLLKIIRVDKDNDGAPLQALATIGRYSDNGAGDFSEDVRTVSVCQLISMTTGDTVSLVDLNLG